MRPCCNAPRARSTGRCAGAGSRRPDSPARRARPACQEAGAPEIAADASALVDRLGRAASSVHRPVQARQVDLLNALVGQSLLPSSIIDTTAVTVLRWGPAARASGWNRTGKADWRPAAYVSEEQNPANCKGVSLVEVFVPGRCWRTGCAWSYAGSRLGHTRQHRRDASVRPADRRRPRGHRNRPAHLGRGAGGRGGRRAGRHAALRVEQGRSFDGDRARRGGGLTPSAGRPAAHGADRCCRSARSSG